MDIDAEAPPSPALHRADRWRRLPSFLAALRLLLRRSGWSRRGDARQLLVERCKNIVGDVQVGTRSQGRAGFDHHVGAAALHDRLVDGAELRADLLRNIGLVALDLLRLASDFLCTRLLLGLKRL